jgi:UDP-2,3-diacylglucosamine hydrolase
LKTAEERNGKILLRFLRSLREKNPADLHLFMLGDIFDLWIGGSSHYAEKFKDLMEALKDLRKAGAKITFIEGNHDVHVEGYFKKKLNIDVHVEAQSYVIDGLRVRAEHGDLINQEDEAYLKYRSIIRNPWVKRIGLTLPGRFWDYLGQRASKKSRAKTGHYREVNKEKLSKMIRAYAEKIYDQEEKYDLIISGHMHIFDDYSFQRDGRAIRSINLGSWFEETVKVFAIINGQPQWVDLPPA